tara:strand:- start:392 stop:658 length:267 start_codon:yes stop_codon:yes gene_type:complete
MNLENAINAIGGPKLCAAALGVSRPTLDKYRSGTEMPMISVVRLAALASDQRGRDHDQQAIEQLRTQLESIEAMRAEVRAELKSIIEG